MSRVASTGWQAWVACLALAVASPALAQGDVAAILAANQAASGSPPSRSAAVRLTYAFAGMGLDGRYTALQDLTDGRFVNTLALGPLQQVQGFDGRGAWLADGAGAVTRQDGGEQRQAAISQAYQNANLWWRPGRGGAAIVAEGVRREGGAAYDVLGVTPLEGRPFDAWFDGKTHLLFRTVQKQGAQTLRNTFSDYRAFSGALQAGTVVADGGAGDADAQTLTLQQVEYLAAAPETAFAPPNRRPADFAFLGGSTETSIPFRLVDNRVYADVAIDGRGPFLFQFDTGATDSMTTALARALSLKTEGRLRDTGAGEGDPQVGLARARDLRIGAAVLRDPLFAVAPDSLRDVEAIGDSGVIGSEVFSRMVTRIDYATHRLTLIDPARFDPKDAGVPVPFVFEGNVIEVAGDFEGVSGRFIIDTGSRADIVLSQPYVARNRLRAGHPRGVEVVAGWGVGGPARAYATHAAAVAIGPVQAADVVAFFSTQTKGAFAGADFDGAIGGGLLRRFVVTLDYGHRTLYLKPLPAPVDGIGAFDRAGLWFNRSPGGFIVVDVVAGGPAAQAGLRAGDRIVRVDGAPAAGLPVWALRRRLRESSAGTLVMFTVRRGGRLRAARVTLRDLI